MPAAKTAKTPETVPTLADLVDELGDCKRKLTPLEPVRKRAEAIRVEILARLDKLAPAQNRTITGHRYTAVVGARQTQRFVSNLAGLMKRLTAKKFFGLCSFTVTALESALSGEEAAMYLDKGAVGPRIVEVTPNP
jgi:hypothetical protein